jgi:predicted transcriptional regulator
MRVMTNVVDSKSSEKLAIEDVFQSKGRIKILKILAKEGELNISEIARRAHINHNSTRYHLNFLVKINILQEKTFGRIRIYRFRIENIKVQAIKKLFDIWEKSNL